MKKEIIWSQDASDDLIDIIQYIKERSGKEIANSIYERIITKIENIASFSEAGRKVPELGFLGNNEYHEIIESPWRIFYRLMEKEVCIISIIDGRRNIEEILYKKIIDGKLS